MMFRKKGMGELRECGARRRRGSKAAPPAQSKSATHRALDRRQRRALRAATAEYVGESLRPVKRAAAAVRPILPDRTFPYRSPRVPAQRAGVSRGLVLQAECLDTLAALALDTNGRLEMSRHSSASYPAAPRSLRGRLRKPRRAAARTSSSHSTCPQGMHHSPARSPRQRRPSRISAPRSRTTAAPTVGLR